jgi:hypothetical protein
MTVMKMIEAFRSLAVAFGAAAATSVWAHPYGHHPQGDVLLVPHAHAEALGSWALAAAFLFAGIALHWLGQRVGGRVGRVAHVAGLGLATGGTLLLFA